MIFSFIADLILLSYRVHKTAEINNNITRIIAKQGGVMTATPNGFPGSSKNYITTSELNDMLKKEFQNIGALGWTATLTRNGGISYDLKDTNLNFKIPNNQYFEIEMKLTYKWGFWASFLGRDVFGYYYTSRSGYTEYNFDMSSY